MTEFDKGYNEGYNAALLYIKSEIEKRLSDKESILKQFSEEDYVSSVAATQYNISVGLGVAKIVINKEIEKVSDPV